VKIILSIGGTGSILDGGDGIDTVSYTQATKGVVNPKQASVLYPHYDRPLKILPLGDSITYGVSIWEQYRERGLPN